VLVVGTNGKGSTAAMLSSLLRAHGVRVGLTTSPHLVSVTERVRIDGEDVTRTELERHLHRLDDFPDLTFFEALTAAAYLAFADAGVEVAVLEAGMGGTWDATRTAKSALAGITNVGSDHRAWLGETARERARDKGGPLRAAELAVLGPQMRADLVPALEAPGAVEAASLVGLEPVGDHWVEVSWDGHRVAVGPPLAGEHQLGNLHLALALARGAALLGIAPPLKPRTVERSLEEVRWPGRLSVVRIGGREIVVDGAHNRESAEALAVFLGRMPGRHSLLFSCLADKPVQEMARVLRPAVAEVALVEMADDRAMTMESMAAAFPGAIRCENVEVALERLPDPVVAAGSLRLVGRLLARAAEGGTA
jgi:dihydrofolate synthase/folylpolyglutamate synthase